MSPARVMSALLALALVLAFAPAAAAEGSLGISELGGTRFPDRAFVLTLPSHRLLDSSQVVARENGRLVSDLVVVPADGSGGRFGAVLVIDASNSMEGAAIEGALAAARAFVEQRSPTQAVAIVTFNKGPKVLLQLTTDAAALEAALASPPPLASGTHIYDAVATAVGLLREAKVAGGSVVVLSDGSDTGSALAGSTVVARAKAAGVRVFAVGLRGKAFRPEGLRALTDGSGGEYAEATSSEQLARLFGTLGSRLASQYVVRYRSHAGPEERVQVEIAVADIAGVASAEYVSPPLPIATEGPFHRPFAETFWRSAAAAVAVSLACALLLGLGIVALLRPRRPALRRRMAEFVSIAAPKDERRQGALTTEKMLAGAEKSLERTAWWTQFKAELEIARIGIPAVQIVAVTAIATLLAAWIASGLGGSTPYALLGLAVPIGVRAVLKRKLERQRRLFAEQLPDNLQVLASALRAGHSLVGALSVVVEDSPEPSRAEFRRVIGDEQLGVSLDEAFMVVVRRMDNRDLEQVALVAALQRDMGGNTAEVLDRVTDTVRERFELRRMVRTLTAQGRMSRWIVSLLPVGLLVFITAVSPEYMRPLFTEPLGRILLVGAAIMLVAGSFVIKKIVDIRV
jgi:tight adherence protein B